MKIRVEHEDGRWETITLEGDMKIVQHNSWDSIVTASGTEYFFTEDGYYMGWAGTAPYSQRVQDAMEEIEEGGKGILVVRKWTSRIQ